MKTRGIIETQDPITYQNLQLLHDRIVTNEILLRDLKRHVNQIDDCLQRLLTSEAQAKLRLIKGCSHHD